MVFCIDFSVEMCYSDTFAPNECSVIMPIFIFGWLIWLAYLVGLFGWLDEFQYKSSHGKPHDMANRDEPHGEGF